MSETTREPEVLETCRNLVRYGGEYDAWYWWDSDGNLHEAHPETVVAAYDQVVAERDEAEMRLDVARKIRKYVAFALTGDENADVQLAADNTRLHLTVADHVEALVKLGGRKEMLNIARFDRTPDFKLCIILPSESPQ